MSTEDNSEGDVGLLSRWPPELKSAVGNNAVLFFIFFVLKYVFPKRELFKVFLLDLITAQRDSYFVKSVSDCGPAPLASVTCECALMQSFHHITPETVLTRSH